MPQKSPTERTIRVVAGQYRGRKLAQPPKNITRPTMSKVKEAMFNMIQFDIEKAVCLDLFSGSGSLAIEAVSRYAMKVVAVDQNATAIQVLKSNLHEIKIKNVDVVQKDVLSYLIGAQGLKFDFIFMDPPFAEYDLYAKVLRTILATKILKPTGYIILETDNISLLQIPSGLIIQKQKKYGISTLLKLSNNI